MKKALILVDIQNDFCKGGALAVPDAESIIPLIEDLMKSNKYDKIIATMDWHPNGHSSFITQTPNGWPIHCVQFSNGSQLHEGIDSSLIDKIIYKGTDMDIDSYSGFYDNEKRKKTELDEYLKMENITDVDIVGLALDYCVSATAIDAVELGYKTKVISQCTKAVNINQDDGLNAIKKMKSLGVLVE